MRISTGVAGATRSTFSRASVAAAGDCSTAMTLSNEPSTASESAMQPDPVPMSAARPRFPYPVSRFSIARSTSSTSPLVSGRGISARASIARSSVRNGTRPTAYANGPPCANRSAAAWNLATASGDLASWRRSHASPTVVPRVAAQSAVSSGTHALLFLRLLQCGDQVVEFAVHHFIDVVGGEVNAVIGDAILREVVGAHLLRAITGPDLRPPFLRARSLLLGDHAVQQPRTQDLEGLDLVLQLRLLILTLHLEPGRQMRHPDRAICGVHALATGTAGPKHIDAEILVFDLDVHLFGFGQDRDRRRRGVNATLLLGDGYALHPMHAGFVAQDSVRLGTARGEDGFLEPTERAGGKREDLDFPAATLAEARVHPEEVCREQRRFIAAGPRPDFHDRVAIVERIGGTEQLPQRSFEPPAARAGPLGARASELGEFGVFVGEDLTRLVELGCEALHALMCLANGVELGVFATELFESGRAPRGLGVGQLPGDLLRPRERLAESGLHGISSLWFRTSGGTAPRGRPCRAASVCP